MKLLTTEETNDYLKSVHMSVGNYGQLRYVSDGGSQCTPRWFNYRAPRDSAELFTFSQHVAGWLHTDKWKIFTIDNATTLTPDQELLLQFIISGYSHEFDHICKNNLLFTFSNNKKEDAKTDIVISYLVFFFLLFEAHGYLTSSKSMGGEHIGVQDGFVYFMSAKNENLLGARTILDNIKKAPLREPEWISELNAAYQAEKENPAT